MSLIPAVEPAMIEGEQRLVLDRVSWSAYLAMSDALEESSPARIRYRRGRMTIVTKSRRNEWAKPRLSDFVRATARALGLSWEDAGESTLRRSDLETALEPDECFYLGDNATRMRGMIDVDLSTQPPPDPALEIEVSYSAQEAMPIYAELGVREVWRFNPERRALTFWVLEPERTYRASSESRLLPPLLAADVASFIARAEAMGSDAWTDELRDNVRRLIDDLRSRGRG